MNKKNDIEVIINNKQYILRGYESQEYLQKIASYINNIYSEYKKRDFYKHLDSEMKSVLIEINIADDYFKARNQIEEAQRTNEENNSEIFNLRHELISTRSEALATQQELKEIKEELVEAQKKIIRLETELEDIKRS